MTQLSFIPSLIKFSLIGISLPLLSLYFASAEDASEACANDVLEVGFYAYFAPVSHSAAEDAEVEEFDTHLGYESDILTALEAMDGVGLVFNRRAIAAWDDIWLRSASPQYDIVGGGITILDSRTRDANGEERVAFTSGHIAFRQSLLVRTEDESSLQSHADLNSDVRVGALAGTTGEFRLLELTGLVDAEGTLAAGVRIDTPQGAVTADGSADYAITPAGETPALAERLRLHPPSATMPQVIYLGGELGEAELIEALGAGEIDALARGEIGNRDAAYLSDGAFAVTALDDQVEYGGFTLDVDAVELASCFDEKVDWLTDSRRIGYAEWVENPAVFMDRAQMWNDRDASET